ncbi:serpin family protein [Persicimonas caeni]|uniref:Serpin family protein n=1 Tax=Persicimonas caeni TaxID=2292766 RepID=A0A4Y6PMM3_PERCE|nr:serpin family protein [Persicimonas caeni]QDG49531.1 serpin family protein [Persicimonas caeni]QED30752.1 serpin family protein [Persicimonas caeni]
MNAQMNKLATLLLSLALAASSAACGGAADDNPADNNANNNAPSDFGEARSDKQRLTNPQVPQADQETLVDGNTAFALDLYAEVADEEDNIFYSPHSISIALAMTYAGARNDTATEMAQVMHYDLPQDRLHPAFNWLDLHLMDLAEEPVNEESEPFQLSVANSIWGQKDYHFESDFLDTLAVNYGAGLRTLDFIEETEASRQTINTWVEDETEDRIKNLLPQGTITQGTRLVLTNAIYFKASWLSAFDEQMTSQGDFTLRDGSTVTADLMQQTAQFPYADMGDYRAVQLPYDGGDVSMLVILPDDLATFESSFDASKLDAVDAALASERVKLTFPKFEFEAPLMLTGILQDMGMVAPFQNADFSGMTGQVGLAITDVVHKAFVAVDEEGTEAAAATAVVVGETSVPPTPVEFRADKPFIFMIRDNQTGSILFMGRIVDPTA